jgi:hypothetical protein
MKKNEQNHDFKFEEEDDMLMELDKRKTIGDKAPREVVNVNQEDLLPKSKPKVKPQPKSFFSKSYEDFLEKETKTKSASLLDMKNENIKKLYNQQLLLDIPHIQVKAYFNCLSTHLMSDAIHDQSIFNISQDFLKEKYKKMKNKKFESNEIKNEVGKTFNFKPTFDYDTNERILFEMKKRLTIRGIENFGYDIFMVENFFDQKVKSKNLIAKNYTKNKSNPDFTKNKNEQQIMYENNPFTKNKRMASYKDLQNLAQLQISNHLSPNMIPKGSIFNPIGFFKQENEITQFPNAFPDRHFSIIRKASTNTDIQSIRNSFLRGESDKSLRKNDSNNVISNKVLYSFNDDVTIDYAADAQDEEYERTRLNSKSIMDLSKIDWSASVLSRTASKLIPVSNLFTICNQSLL